MSDRLLFIHALSPLHAGTGQSTGAVELAIARDRATGAPYLPGSSIKGALRVEVEPSKREALFGPETSEADKHAGTLIFGDANLLLLPVRSVAGTFSWVTSPLLLAKLCRDCEVLGVGGHPLPRVPDVPIEECYTTDESSLEVKVGDRAMVVFEDLDLSLTPRPEPGQWADWIGKRLFADQQAWTRSLRQRIAIVHDDVMSFLWTHATDVVARVALEEEAKVVRQGGLWHEEALPTETVLVAIVAGCPNERAGVADPVGELAGLIPEHMQFGGKASVGRGRCRLRLCGE